MRGASTRGAGAKLGGIVLELGVVSTAAAIIIDSGKRGDVVIDGLWTHEP